MQTLKKLAVLAFLILCTRPLRAQTQTAVQTQTFTTTTSTAGLGLAGSNTQFHTLQWWGFGTLSMCTVKEEQSADNSSWSDLITAQDCTANGVATIPGTPNYVRITVTALAGGGNVTVRYTGYSSAPLLLASSSGYTTVEDEGVAQTQRTTLNFTGAGVTCSDDGTNTVCDITSGGGGTPGGANTQIQYNNSGAFGGVTKWTTNGTTTLTGIATAILDASAAATLKVPVAAGYTTTANGMLGYDTTSTQGKIYQNGADRYILTGSSVGSSDGQIPIWNNATKTFVPGDPLVQGLTAHDAAGAATNPVATGCYAAATAPTEVSADVDVTRTRCDRSGTAANYTPTVTVSGTLGALNDAVTVSLEGRTAASIAVTSGTLTGTVQAQISYDGGSNWKQTEFIRIGPAIGNILSELTNPAADVNEGAIIPPGATNFRLTVTAYMSGSVDVELRASMTSSAATVILGTDWTTGDPNPLWLDSDNGGIRMKLMDGQGNDRSAYVTASNALKVDGSGVTQPVSGTVTVTDGAGALNVICDSGCAGGTQYTEGDTDASITGTAIMWEDAADTLRAVSTAKPLPVQGTVTVTDGAGALNVICDSGCSGGTQYDEDTATTAADKITMAGVVRSDTLASLVNADGDRTQLQVNAAGALYTAISGTVTVSDGAGAMNVIVDSGTITTITNPVTVTDGAGSLNTIVDSGTITTVSALGNSTTGPQKAEDVASADADVGIPAMCTRKATAANTSNADGDYEFMECSAGRLWVDASGVTLTVGSHAVTNAGTFAVQVDGNALTSLQLIDDTVFAEDTGHNTGDKGNLILGVRAASPTDRSAGPTDGDYEPFGVNEVGAVWVTPTPSINGGSSVMCATGADGCTALTSTVQAIKASAGVLTGGYCYNPNASAEYIIFYNTASGSVTVGTTNPLFSIAVPASSAFVLPIPYPIAFGTAMSWAATSTAGGNGAPGTAMECFALYK